MSKSISRAKCRTALWGSAWEQVEQCGCDSPRRCRSARTAAVEICGGTHARRSRSARSLRYHFGDVTVDRNPGRHIARGEDRRIAHGPAAGNHRAAGVRGSPVAGPVSAWDAGSRPGDRPGDWSDPSAAWFRSVVRKDRLGVAAFHLRVARFFARVRRCGAGYRDSDSSNIRPAGGTRDSRVASSTSAHNSTTSRLEFTTGSINSGEEPLGQQTCTSWSLMTNLVYRNGRDLGRGGFPFIHCRQTCTDGIGEALRLAHFPG